MKHVSVNSNFAYSEEPFPAFRSNLSFGRNKRDFQFLPVSGVFPEQLLTITSNYYQSELRKIAYCGYDLSACREALVKSFQDSGCPGGKLETPDQAADNALQRGGSYGSNNVKFTVGPHLLPTGKFKLIKTKGKGTIMVVPGEDTTNRCLLMAGVTGGFRGACGMVGEETTANVLKTCRASSACESGTDVIAVLEPGQRVVFYSYGRRSNDIIVLSWDGQEIHRLEYTADEWKQCACACSPPEDAEEI